MGLFERLFGNPRERADKRTVEAGQICSKCGQPVPLDNLAFDSGGGRPIHRQCPEARADAAERGPGKEG